MSAPGEAKPSRGPKGAAARDSHEGDVRSLGRHEQSKEAEEMSVPGEASRVEDAYARGAHPMRARR